MKLAYCTGFWCTNIGNSFFSLGVEYVLKKILGNEKVTVVSDLQTYTTSYGRRLFPHSNQLEYISKLDVDCIVLAGPVISKYFLGLWKDILLSLEKRGVKYALLSAGMMKMNETSMEECKLFFKNHPPLFFSSRDESTFLQFGSYAKHSYNGICFSFFAPDFYNPCNIKTQKYFVYNFDKIIEPEVNIDKGIENIQIDYQGFFNKITSKTDRFSDALIYLYSFLPQKQRENTIGDYSIIRTDHRFHPHFRSKIYAQKNSFCADLPYGYLNLYANSTLTLSDRVHACAVTMAYGNSAMLFTKTNRVGLLERVGATDITQKPTKLDLDKLNEEKNKMVNWLKGVIETEGIKLY